MADIGTLTVTLGVNASGLLTAKAAVNGFVQDIQNKVPKITPALTQPFQLFSKQAVSSLAMVSQRMRTFGYLASATITAPMVLAGKSVINMAKDYEFAIQKIVGLTGTAQSVVDSWSKDIQNMAKEFGRNPKELAEGLYFIASSGIHGAQALDVLQKSAKAAASGLGTTKEVANYLTSVLNAYRGTGLTAAYATDVLVAAVREGKAEASGFAAAMGSLIPIASHLGVSIDQVAGAMAGITLTGSTAAQAATYLRGIFNVLMKETKQGAVAMDEASQALGTMKTSYADLRKILREQGVMALMAKLNELTEAYGETLVSKVFPNIRAMLGVLSLSGKNMEYNSEVIKRITNSSGSLAKAFAAVADTIKVRYDKALSTAQVSMISLGKSIAETIIPVLEWLVDKLDSLAKRFDALSESQKRNKVMWGVFIAAAGPAALLFSTLGYTITFIIQGINKLLSVLAKVQTVLGVSSKIIGGWVALAVAVVSVGVAIYKHIKANNELKNAAKEINEQTATQIFSLNSVFTKLRNAKKGTEEYAAALKLINDRYGKYLPNLLTEKSSLEQVANAQRKVTNALIADVAVRTYQDKIENLAKGISKSFDKEMSKFTQVFAEMKGADRLGEFINAIMEGADKEIKLGGGKIEKGMLEFSETAKNIWDTYIQDISQQTGFVKFSLGDFQKAFLDFTQVKAKKGGVMEYMQAMVDMFDDLIPKAKAVDYVVSTVTETTPSSKTIETLNEVTKAIDDIIKKYREEIKYIEMMNRVSQGGTRFEFDINTSKLNAAQQALESLIREVSKVGDLDILGKMGGTIGLVGTILTSTIEDLVLQVQKYKKAISDRADQQQLRVLELEADAFGGLAGKIEVVSYALQAAQRDLRNMFSQKAMNEGYMLDEKEVQKTVDRINQLKTQLVDLQNAQDLRWLNDINNAMNTATTNSDLLAGEISALENKLKSMSETGQAASDTFKTLAKDLKNLQIAQEAVDVLSNAFEELFMSIVEGGKNIQETLTGIFKSIVQSILSELSKLLAQKIIMSILGIGKTNKFLGSFGNLLPGIGLHGFAQGGVVPSGYPNDTYPALLSSGETILPKGLSEALTNRNTTFDGEVRFEIEGDRLVGILKKQAKKSSIY